MNPQTARILGKAHYFGSVLDSISCLVSLQSTGGFTQLEKGPHCYSKLHMENKGRLCLEHLLKAWIFFF